MQPQGWRAVPQAPNLAWCPLIGICATAWANRSGPALFPPNGLFRSIHGLRCPNQPAFLRPAARAGFAPASKHAGGVGGVGVL